MDMNSEIMRRTEKDSVSITIKIEEYDCECV